jgi:predicted RecB family nuclease
MQKHTNPFKLKDFRGVDMQAVARLAQMRIQTTSQMLLAAATPSQRQRLSCETGIPEASLLELVKLSDLARLPGVKGIRARLYYDAGVDTVARLAACEPEALLQMTAEFVQRAGFAGLPPLPKEVSSTIENAKKLPTILIE